MGRTLTETEIESLIKYDKNMSQRLGDRAPVFSKEQTIEILNAVTELRTVTDNGEWTIRYSDNGKRFFVKPGPNHQGKSTLVPCGNYRTEWAMDRLQL